MPSFNFSSLKTSRLSADVVAGVTLAALGIPEVMGYTKIIGTPVITGLYTMLFPMLVFALLGSSRYLVVAADSATAAIVAAALLPLAGGSSAEYLELTSLVALTAGVLLLLADVLRLGFLANFLSRTVLVGFLSGVGVQVALGETHGMLGLPRSEGANFFANVFHTFEALAHTHLPSLWIALSVIVISLALRRIAARFPGPLLALVIVIIANSYFHFGELGVQLVGTVPQGLPHFILPALSYERILSVFGVAFSCFVVILAQSAATARAYAFQFKDALDENRDLLGLGAANIAAALSGTFVVNSSPTKTEMVVSAGGRSQWAHISAACVVLVVLLFLTGPLALLPNPALAAIVFLIGVKLIDVSGLRDIAKYSRMEFGLALLTAGTVIILGVEQGILLALALSLLYHVRRSYRPSTAVETPDANGHWLSQKIDTRAEAAPGLLVYRFGADLFYANVDHFRQEIEHLVAKGTVKWVVVDAGAITGIDFTATEVVARIQQNLKRRSLRLMWVHASSGLVHDLKKAGILQPDCNFETLRECLAEFRKVSTR